MAAILAVFKTCRRLKIRLRDYLAAVLPGLADQPLAGLHALTPVAWAATQPSRSTALTPPPSSTDCRVRWFRQTLTEVRL